MTSTVPLSIAVTAVAAANAAAAAAIGSSTAPPASIGPLLFAEQANNLRLMAVYDRISLYLSGAARFEPSDVIRVCYCFAKAIDCSLTLNDIPGIAPRLPPLVKKVYEWRKNAALQSAIMMVLISIKNACKRGWFRTADSEELLCMADELYGRFCTELCPNIHVNHAYDTISKIMPRFYPRLTLCSLIISFEAKPGYDVLMSDFHSPKNYHPEQKIVLFVIKTENLETSSCIASPPQVSFLINGKGVMKRNNVSLDSGPQLPTDISKMLKYGINILQTIGYFDGTYLIAIAYMSKLANYTLPALKDYVQPVLTALDSVDSEIIEGPSRILLSCPISFKRMKTPVKGHLCKHHQCFDYENFMEMNSRKPIWRCPHCNQPVSMADLRIDQNMVKILGEVGEDVTEVVIHADGSWNVVSEQGRCTADRPHDEAQVLDQADDMECEMNRSKTQVADHVDLTLEEDGNCSFLTQDGCYDRIIEEAEDRKPFSDSMPQFLASHAPPQASPPAYQLGNSLQQPTFFPSYAANGPPLPDQTHLGVGNASERTAGRAGFTRIVDRNPTAVQALPVPQPLQQIHAASRRLHSNMIDCALAPNLSPMQYQAVNMSTPSPLDAFGGGLISNNMDAQQHQQQQFTRIADASAIQDLTQQNQQYAASEAAQAVGVASPSTLSSRSPFSHRRGSIDMDAFRASLQPSPFARTPSLPTPPGFRTQSPNLPPAAARQAPHGGGFGNHQRLPPQFLRSLPSSATAPISAPPRDNARAIGSDRWRSLTGGGTPSLDQGWRPTGRMRGSLTGSDYSAVISNYMPPTAVNNLMAHGATAAGQDASGDARI